MNDEFWGYVLFILLLSTISTACGPSALVNSGGSTISGRAVYADSLQPLSGVQVGLKSLSMSSSHELEYIGQTFASGGFSLRGVKPGVYSLEAHRAGMVLVGNNKVGERIRVAARKDIRGIRLEMRPGVRLAGTVRGMPDHPVELASVEVMRVTSGDGAVRYVPAGRTVTDTSGWYSIDILPLTPYVLFALPGRSVISELRPADIATFYPNSANPSMAEVLTTESSTIPIARDIKMRRAIPGRLRLQVEVASPERRDDGEQIRPIVGLTLRGVAFSRDSGMRFPPITVSPNSVEFRDLGPAKYVAYAIMPSAHSKGVCKDIDLSEGQRVDRTLVIGPGSDMAGQIIGVPAAELKAARVVITPIESPVIGLLSGGIDESGKFSLRGIPPCHFALTISGLPSGVSLRSINTGTEEVSPGKEIDLQKASGLLLHVGQDQ